MTKQSFIKKNCGAKGFFNLVGDFTNEYGEDYVIIETKYRSYSPYFIAGDETDWEIWELMVGDDVIMLRSFMLCSDEKDKIRQIVQKPTEPDNDLLQSHVI